MERIDKEQLREFIERELIKSLGIKKDMSWIKNDNELKSFIDDLYDVSGALVYPFTEQETYIIRKLYGVFDNGIIQSNLVIADELDCSVSKIEKIINKSICSLYEKRILRGYEKILYVTKMTSADVEGAENIKNIELNLLMDSKVSSRIFSVFAKNDIVTFGDLLTYSICDLKMLFDNMEIDEIINLVHCFGLKFIDELSDEEKVQIISKSSVKRIMDSSISWIEGEETFYNNFISMGIDNLNKLVQMINNNWFYFIDFTKDVQIYETEVFELLGEKIDLMALEERYSDLMSKRGKLQNEMDRLDIEINNILEQIKGNRVVYGSKKLVK